MNRLLLLNRPVLLLDGGLGTTLEDEHGVPFSAETPLWSSHMLVEETCKLQAVQRDFAVAGADIILTATYQASMAGFRNTKAPGFEHGIDRPQAKEFMQSAVRLARESFGGGPGLVALSLGAYGATLIPSAEYNGKYGEMDEVALYEFHLERLLVFRASKVWDEVDLLAFETLPRLDEVRAATRVMEEVTDKEYWISCVFPNDDRRLPDGSDVRQLVKTVLTGARKPLAIGLNCTRIHKVAELILEFEAVAAEAGLSLPRLVVYPDAAGGQVYDTTLQQWVGQPGGERQWDEQVCSIIHSVQQRNRWEGILVGGCCKTPPTLIKRLRIRVDDEIAMLKPEIERS